jgi:nitronate monooxygenase
MLLHQHLNVSFPVIMAPMFLVTNEPMLIKGMEAGIMATFPSLNYRNEGELDKVLKNLNSNLTNHVGKGSYGINLIVQKSNIYYQKHLKICVDNKVPFYITSLGNPKEVIEQAHAYGAKVYCDVVNVDFAQKCVDLGADGLIAVGSGAGGHAGPNPLQVLIPALRHKFPNTPVIAAGGIANGETLLSMLVLGASGASIGTRFIACNESGVNDAYKNAIVTAKMDDIVMTSKLSGTPCTIINTDDAKAMGYEQGWLEKTLSNNPRTKKWFKTLVQLRGFKRLENSVLANNYKKLWCAGKSVELINNVDSVVNIVSQLKTEFAQAQQQTAQIKI